MEEMEIAEKDYIGTLREHGLQVTYQRLAIYQALCATKEHLSAEEIHQQVKKRFPMISLGTVYKSLERLHAAGVIQKPMPTAEVVKYESNLSNHHHLVCLKCNAIFDVSDPALTADICLNDCKDFRPVRHQVIIEGYCSSCAKKMNDKD